MGLHDTQRIREADAICARLNRRIADLDQKIKLGPGRIFRRVSDSQSEAARISNMVANDFDGFILGFVKFRIQVNFGCGIKYCYAVGSAGFGLIDALFGGDRMCHYFRF